MIPVARKVWLVILVWVREHEDVEVVVATGLADVRGEIGRAVVIWVLAARCPVVDIGHHLTAVRFKEDRITVTGGEEPYLVC